MGKIQRTVNELGLVPGELAHCEFSVGGLRGTVSAWEIVDHDTQNIVTRNVGNSGLKSVDVGDGVAVSCCVSLLPRLMIPRSTGHRLTPRQRIQRLRPSGPAPSRG